MSTTTPSGTPERPRQVTMVGVLLMVGAVLVVMGAWQLIAGLETVETREQVEQVLSDPPLSGLGVGVPAALQAIKILAMVAAASAVAAGILGWQVMQRSRTARVALSVLAVPLLLAGMLSGGLVAALMAGAVVSLWLQPAHGWFKNPPEVPASTRPQRVPQPPQEARPASDHRPWESAPPPSSTGLPPATHAGPSAFQGFGTTTATAAGTPAPAGRSGVPGPLRGGLVLAWAACTMVVIGLVLAIVSLASDPASLNRSIDDAIEQTKNSAFASSDVTRDDVRAAIYAMLGLAIAWAVAAAGVAVLAWRGHRWAWLALCISGAVAAVGLLVLSLGEVALLLPLMVMMMSLGLLLRPESRAWYRRR
ncbi:hypothetical protein [Nocardioides acrostichi]|uniref:DUF4064 domain-containing protein n=1 Tax=Nocardioides acrostichi TaxID=2784339 RepID=A0A930V058_9ACTN|nr:hypothetical protein [Nocardioides acrostichi]MBF4161312.1 hypothetical protein [Nocardioides acrostichi]